MMRRFLVMLGLTTACGWWTLSTAACPFCSEERGPTLVGDFNQATMVLVGMFQNPMLGKGGLEDGTTDFTIEQILKSNDIIKNKKIITLPRYLPNAKKNKFVVFCDVYKG